MRLILLFNLPFAASPHMIVLPGFATLVIVYFENCSNGVFWILRTGAPWRDLPETYGNWKNVHRRFCRWRDKGIWERILEALVDDTDFEWLMIDASHVKVHPDAAGAQGGNQAMGRTKGGSTPRYIWPWMRMVCRCDSLSLLVPLRIAQLQRS